MRSRSLLPWIIAFKAFKAITLTTLGIVLLVTRHADPVDAMEPSLQGFGGFAEPRTSPW
jgi:hypothetical protein